VVIIGRRLSLLCRRCAAKKKINPSSKVEPLDALNFTEQKLLHSSHKNFDTIDNGILGLPNPSDASLAVKNYSEDSSPTNKDGDKEDTLQRKKEPLNVIPFVPGLDELICEDDDGKGVSLISSVGQSKKPVDYLVNSRQG